MMQFFYTLMMGGDAIIDGVPLQQYLGPLITKQARAGATHSLG